jgi:hypothetical protein
LRAPLAAFLALILGGCVPQEPSEADLLRALQRHHQDWAGAQRRHAAGEYAPLVNLSAEAALSLYIRSVTKERCWQAQEESGYICRVQVEASTAYASNLRRRIEARFVEGMRGWIAVSPRSLEAIGSAAR